MALHPILEQNSPSSSKIWSEKKDLKNRTARRITFTPTVWKIYTTMIQVSEYAEQASREHMEWLQKRYFRQWKGMTPWSYETDEFQKNWEKKCLIKPGKSVAQIFEFEKKIVWFTNT